MPQWQLIRGQIARYVVGAGQLVNPESSMSNWIVCGWYTPDYSHWAVKLAASLDAVGAPHRLYGVEKLSGSWAAETMRKPSLVRTFRQDHPDSTIILLDVDCQVTGSLEPLVDSVRADVAAHLMVKKGGMKVMSGTMVFRPTSGANAFVEAWIDAVGQCGDGAVDQIALMHALGAAGDFTFQPLGPQWCHHSGNTHPSPVIVHSNAGAHCRRKSVKALLRSVAGRISLSAVPYAVMLA